MGAGLTQIEWVDVVDCVVDVWVCVVLIIPRSV